MHPLLFLVMQILPGMSDILGTLPSVNPRVQQPCLQFTYWSVVFMEQTVQGSQVLGDCSCYTHVKCVYSRIRVRIFASRFYSRDVAHVAPDYTILSLF